MKIMRNKIITVRLTEEELAFLKTKAEESSMKMEPLIRALIGGQRFQKCPQEEKRRLLRQLSGISNNLSQIFRCADLHDPGMAEMKGEIEALQTKILKKAKEL
ncbi:MAG: plasmid mobilization relaxosome protein MobC [Firmicutes bacterium HGW-Firmicutes-16]|nr:MAG: plasmid mobilization relaxosome protein MobC [Firmicutes bacterium HGW-Firmicutes-16]